MARISSYPIISSPSLTDLLLGTDVEDLNNTKNFLLEDIAALISLGFVPYIGATGSLNMGLFSVTASSFIVNEGLSSQFLKADGSLDATSYVPFARSVTINGTTYDLSEDREWDLPTINALTTNGTGGSSTYINKVLNIPIYQSQGNYITQLSGEATALGPGNANVVLSNSAVINKILTGLNITGGNVIATDSILQAFGKVQNQINSLVGGVQFEGLWNADTNIPTLQSSVGSKGDYYVVSVAGSTDLNGITDWKVGDWAIFDGSAWSKVDNTDAVISVNGYVGAVELTYSDVDAAAAARMLTINGVGYDLSADRSWTVGDVRTDGSYSNPTWITSLDWGKISGTPTTLLGYGITDAVNQSRTLTINGTTYDLSANRSWNVGTVTSIGTSGPITGGTITGSGTIGINQAGLLTDGYLSFTDWNTFNSKQGALTPVAPITLVGSNIGITQSGVSSDGYLSSTDWNTFNNKQNALTNPVTGTGTAYTLPMWSGATSLTDSPLSYASDTFNFQYNSVTGGSVVFQNNGLTPYAYTITMNNFGSPRTTTHNYTDGVIVNSIAGVPVSRIFSNGNTIVGSGSVDNGHKLEVEGDVYANWITLNPAPVTIPTSQGSMYFDQDEQTVAAVLNGSIMKIGEDSFFQIKNNSGATIPKGTAVRFDGVVGSSGRVLAVPFLADGTYPSLYFLGVTYESIPDGGDGKALILGKIRGINTNAYPAGTILYASTTVAGGYQTTPPLAPNNIISVAAVVTQGTSNGTILVRPQLGSNINNDEGVKIVTPVTGDLLQLQAGGLWENKSVASLSLVPQSRTLSINGTSYDLTANRSWDVGTITSLTGEATASGSGAVSVTLDNTAVIGKVLTGLNITGGTVVSTDSILTALGKVQNQINGLIGGSIFQGTWDANTNTPALTSSVGTNGHYYIVSVAGTTNLNGITNWEIGDWAIFAGTTWQKVDNTDAVASVNGYTGTVSLVTGDVLEGAGSLPGRPSQLYFTDARARAAISLTTSGTSGAATYDNGTGVLNIPNYLQDLSGYVPYTGATANVDLGIYNITPSMVYISGAGTGGGGVLNLKKDTTRTVGGADAANTISVWADGATLGFNDWVSGNVRSAKFSVASITNNATRTYTLPNADGTLALTSDIPSLTNYVTLDTAQTITGAKTLTALLTGTRGSFASSGSDDTFAINHSSGSGIGLNITKGGNGEGLYVNKTSGSGNAATIIGTLNATTFVKSGGTSSQFLKADGSVDSTAYGTGSVTSVGLSSSTSGVTISLSPVTTSGTINLSILTASGSQNGLLSSTDWTTFNSKQAPITLTTTGTSGAATFSSNTLNIPNYTVLSLAAIGISPNANGASIVGSLLSLQPASASFGGVVTTGAQTFAGDKTLTGALNGTSATFSNNVSINANSARLTVSESGGAEVRVTAGGSSGFIGTYSNHSLTFLTNSTTALTLASTGAATFSSTAQNAFLINSTNTDGPILQIQNSGNNLGLIGNAEGITNGGATNFAIRATNNLIFSTGGANPRMTITSSGRVLIGTDADTGLYKLDVNGTGRFSGALTGTSATFSTNGDNLTLNNASGQYTTINFRNGGVNKSQIYWDNSGNRFYVTDNLYFSTSGAATFPSSVTASSFIKTGTGEWGTFNSAASGASSASYYQNYGTDSSSSVIRWYVGQNAFRTDGSFAIQNTAGTGLYLTTGNTSWTSTSDERSKDIIRPITNALNDISSWRTVVGKYKNDDIEKERLFLIAQDILLTTPQVVDVSDEGNLGLRYLELIPVLVKAIQEQQAQIEELKALINK